MGQLQELVIKSGLKKTKATFILEKFQGYFDLASEWENKAKEIVVTDESQSDLMKKAREGRLFLKQRRIEIEKTRKELKDDALKEGKAIDGIANVLKGLIEPIESYLDNQEKFIEIQEAKRKEERKIIRQKELNQIEADFTFVDILNMNDENYKKFFESQKKMFEEKKEMEKKAELERIEQEKREREEQEKYRLENERLRKENEEREKKLKEEYEKTALIEAELKRKEQEEIIEKQNKIAEAQRIKEGSDKEKIYAVVRQLMAIEYPDAISENGIEIMNIIKKSVANIIKEANKNCLLKLK